MDIEALFWGLTIIATVSVSAIIVVLGIYYLITKYSEGNRKKRQSYSLEEQKEIK
ncbi:hypothetical protein JW766_02775 [Candidatus Dojkabacteria bacterium]|nr:hypothetical protein [Candidatus Dojkabacteria bacterium]